MDKRAELLSLFQEFAISYPASAKGKRHLAFYDEGRRQARQNFAAILAADERREDVTEQVLVKFLPYADSTLNRQKGAWIHIAPAIGGELEDWLQRSGWTKPEHRWRIAKGILGFVRRCAAEPAQLSAACAELSEHPHGKGFGAESLSPVLNALRPADFLLIHNKSLQVLNYFADKSHSLSLTDYPEANATGHGLIAEMAEEMRRGLPEVPEVDIFDMFSYWLVTVKRYRFGGAPFTIRKEMYKRWPPMW